MPSTIWTGSIGFGLVNIPVSLVTAEQRDDLDFTLLDKRDSSPIGYQKISKRTGKPVPGDRIVRGVEQANGRYVVVSDTDLRRASPRLVADMTEDWDPRQYHDEYREELLAFIKKRGRAGQLTAAPETEEAPATRKRAEIIDIAELLKRSLARTGEARRRPRRRKSA